MNFFAGRVECENDKPSFVIDGETLVLPQNLRAVLQEHHGRKMILGIRPEDISQAGFPAQVGNAISATAEVIEPLGARTDVAMTNSTGRKFIINAEPHTRLKARDAVRVYINVDKVHIFESEGAGRNVTLPD